MSVLERLSTSYLSVRKPVFELFEGVDTSAAASASDIGYYGSYYDGKDTRYTGLYRDESDADNAYILFENMLSAGLPNSGNDFNFTTDANDMKRASLKLYNISASGNLSAVDAKLSGNLSAVDGTFSGAISGDSASITNGVNAASATLSGTLSAVNGTFSGDISADDGTFSGDLSAVDAKLSGNLSAVDGTFSGAISGDSASITNGVSAVSATLSGNLSAVDGTFSGIVSTSNATNATSTSTGSVTTAGGMGIAQDVWIGGSLHVAGDVSLPPNPFEVIIKTSSATISESELKANAVVFVDAASAVTITLPTLSTLMRLNNGQNYSYRMSIVNLTNNDVTISAAQDESIEGSASYVLYHAYDKQTLIAGPDGKLVWVIE